MQRFLFSIAILTAAVALADGPNPVDQYNVVWDSPSKDCRGSMPLGNGDIGLNVWIEPDGGLQLLISKTDAWDDNARLVKVGKVSVRLDPNPFAGKHYCQTLKLSEGRILVSAGPDKDSAAVVAVWADANRPMIHVTVDSPTPTEATAAIELWRNERVELAAIQCSDIMLDRSKPGLKHAPTFVEPDVVLANQTGRIGWYHHNVKSVGPQLLAEIQGLTDFKQADPLLHRTFGALVTAAGGQRVDDRTLRSPRGKSHRFNVTVETVHPATPEAWLAKIDKTAADAERIPFEERLAAHQKWWGGFWNRSWIRATAGQAGEETAEAPIPPNAHPVMIGRDQKGGSRFSGELGRVSLFDRPLGESDVLSLAKIGPDQPLGKMQGVLFSGNTPGPVADSAGWTFPKGLTIEAWLKPGKGDGRIVDKITVGGSDGFLFDTHPGGRSLRVICGSAKASIADALPPDAWTHVALIVSNGGLRLFVNGKTAADAAGADPADPAAYVSQMYHLQRFITACAGRGHYPIKFNGTIFTVAPNEKEDPDYRRWGPGYWWQNTRLPYISMATAGDYEMMRPLFKMYCDDLLELCKYRTKHYLGHQGAYYPECIYFWGPCFSETYGWTPFEQRTDKLQSSGWHKWEWVGGLELCWLMLDYYDHTQDREFLDRTAFPFCREILTFFDRHYSTDEQGKLVMTPSQALETWWQCTNPMPELAGCIAVTERLLALPDKLACNSDRHFWTRFRAKLPELPLRDIDGKKALAPAEKFDHKSNIENPELYAVFPFRLIAFDRPNAEWGVEALEHRWDRGHRGWRQDDLFMTYLGLTDAARKAIVQRATHHDRNHRFPAFWGPNYDWTPDQDHGGVLNRTFQTMLLQTNGDKILLLPAWPKSWNAEFRLHAPKQTIVEGTVRDGKLERLIVTPESRRKDVVVRE